MYIDDKIKEGIVERLASDESLRVVVKNTILEYLDDTEVVGNCVPITKIIDRIVSVYLVVPRYAPNVSGRNKTEELMSVLNNFGLDDKSHIYVSKT